MLRHVTRMKIYALRYYSFHSMTRPRIIAHLKVTLLHIIGDIEKIFIEWPKTIIVKRQSRDTKDANSINFLNILLLPQIPIQAKFEFNFYLVECTMNKFIR
jgi:hypothetical protein